MNPIAINPVVIMVTAYGDVPMAVEALHKGAENFLTKPVDLRQFRMVVASALGRAAKPAPAPGGVQSPRAKPGRAALERLVGGSAVMQQVRDVIEQLVMDQTVGSAAAGAQS